MSYFHIELKTANDVLQDEFFVNAMHEEFEQFVRNDIWKFEEKPDNINIIGTKWIFKIKLIKMELLLETKHT